MIRIGANFSSFYFSPYIQCICPILSIHLWYNYNHLPLSVTSLLQDFITLFLDKYNSFLTDFPASALLFPLSNLQPFQTNILKILLLLCYSSIHTISWFPISYYTARQSGYSCLSTPSSWYSSILVLINTYPTLCHTIHIFLTIIHFSETFFLPFHLLVSSSFSKLSLYNLKSYTFSWLLQTTLVSKLSECLFKFISELLICH